MKNTSCLVVFVSVFFALITVFPNPCLATDTVAIVPAAARIPLQQCVVKYEMWVNNAQIYRWQDSPNKKKHSFQLNLPRGKNVVIDGKATYYDFNTKRILVEQRGSVIVDTGRGTTIVVRTYAP